VKISTLNLLFCATALLTSSSGYAAPILITGTPGNANLAVPTGPVPGLGNLITFDSTSTCTSTPCSSLTILNATFSSPDGLLVLPFSSQSFPNELFDNSATGTANLSIQLAFGVDALGVGIADSDPVTITLQALNSSGTPFGTAFAVTIPENTPNPGNGYFVLSDSTPDIYGLLITQSTGNANNSGLAIDDVQTTPEPSTGLLLASGVALLAGLRLRKRA
jgi:PEP-CTERM motif